MSTTLPPSPPSPPAPQPPAAESASASKSLTVCQVCGDYASIINYGVLSCLSCRTFFRRNAFHKKEMAACRFSGHCEVTKTTRKLCTTCRLTKCLLVGMSPELIRKEDLSVVKRKPSQFDMRDGLIRPRLMTVPSATTVSLRFDHDTSFSLTDSERKLIANVVHAFDTFSPVPEIRRTIEMISASASNLQFDSSQPLQFLSLFSQALLSFISSTPDFNVLTSAEQISLFQRNMLGVSTLGGIYLMRECGIFDRPENGQAMLPLYGDEIFRRVKLVGEQLDTDSIVIRLLLIAVAFSSNCSTIRTPSTNEPDSLLFGTFRLFGSQNVYAELIWKYLSDSCGTLGSVRRFSRLVNSLLDTLTLANDIYDTNLVFQQFITDRLRQIDHSVNLRDKTVTSLWGKR